MSSQGPDTAAAAPKANPDLENESVILGDPSLSQESRSLEQAVAQSHDRNKSGSSSIYYDTLGAGESSRNVADESERQSQSDLTSEDGGVRLKGKEPSNIVLEEAQEGFGAEDPFGPPAQLSTQSERIRKAVDESVARMAQFTQRERPIQPGGNSRPSYYSGPDPQPNRELTGADLVRNAFGGPPTRQQSFGAHRNPEEDRKNWERIRATTGPSTPQYNYNSRQAGFISPSNLSGESPSRVAQKRKSSPNDDARGLDGTESSPSAAHPGLLRPPPYDESSSSGRNASQLPCTHPSLSRQNSDRRARPDVVIPRWQPDAEVTLCPICGTQFSFFVRKHHCRKCGRVVCAACSPHRITIPYQFIVQPPTESETLGPALSRARPALDPARAGSSSEFESLGGGERVRLCNPCVPDPNTAPPQTPTFATQPQSTPPRNAHSRSASSTSGYATPSQPTLSSSNPSERPSGISYNYRQRARQPSILGRQPSDPWNSSGPRPSFVTRPTVNSGPQNPAYADYRTRSSTVSGSAVRQDTNYPRPVPALSARVSGVLAAPGAHTNRGPPTLVPRAELQARPLPRVPRPPRIAEEDECPICHQELPSSQLPNAEDLRAVHITNCIENAMQGSSTTSPEPQTTSSNIPPQASPSAPSSSSTPAHVANTPEARMAAREQAHAAVVLGTHSSPSPAYRRTGVFPYKATEKDCVDDAECTICLEEFEVGQDMGRLECFCRFHLHCIREWFVNHYGQCPVHHQAY